MILSYFILLHFANMDQTGKVTAKTSKNAKSTKTVKTEKVEDVQPKVEHLVDDRDKTEQTKVDLAKTEPAKTEPAKAEPVKAEPVKAEPAKAEPVKADQPNNEEEEEEEDEAGDHTEGFICEEGEEGEEGEEDTTPAGIEKAKKSRVLTANILQIDISPARCVQHIRQRIGEDKEEKQKLSAARQALKNTPENTIEYTTLLETITTLSPKFTRVSGETQLAVGTIWDVVTKQLLLYGVKQAIEAKSGIVNVCHLHNGKPQELVYYPIFCQCQAWTDYDPLHEAQLKTEQTEHNKQIKAAREKKEEAPKAKKSSETSKMTFLTYVENALKTLRKDVEHPETKMRVSKRIRAYIAEIIAQGIAIHTDIYKILIKYEGTKTITADHVCTVANMMLSMFRRNPNQITELNNLINTKLELYKNHMIEESKKKLDSMPDESRQKLEKNKKDLETAKKIKQAEATLKRAAMQTQKIKDAEAILSQQDNRVSLTE